MNCIEHNDRSAVGSCAKCGAGLCNDCITGSVFRNDHNLPFCKKCNYEVACENDRIFNATLKSKQIIMYIYIGAVVAGLILLLVLMAEGYGQLSILAMLLCWALGSVSNIFDYDSGLRKFLRKISNSFSKAMSRGSFILIIASLIGTIIGIILGFAIMGAFSPIMIIMCLIGIGRVKKQIANNNEALSRLSVENSQN